MRQHVLRSRTTGVPGGAALQPTTSKGPTLAVGTAHGSGSVPFAGPQEAHHDPLQVNRNLTEKQGHDAEPASPETSTGRRAPPDRPSPPATAENVTQLTPNQQAFLNKLKAREHEGLSYSQSRASQMRSDEPAPSTTQPMPTVIATSRKWGDRVDEDEAEENLTAFPWAAAAGQQSEEWATDEVSPSYRPLDDQRFQKSRARDPETESAYRGLDRLSLAHQLEETRQRLAGFEQRASVQPGGMQG